jgi:hypothetical protein
VKAVSARTGRALAIVWQGGEPRRHRPIAGAPLHRHRPAQPAKPARSTLTSSPNSSCRTSASTRWATCLSSGELPARGLLLPVADRSDDPKMRSRRGGLKSMFGAAEASAITAWPSSTSFGKARREFRAPAIWQEHQTPLAPPPRKTEVGQQQWDEACRRADAIRDSLRRQPKVEGRTARYAKPVARSFSNARRPRSLISPRRVEFMSNSPCQSRVGFTIGTFELEYLTATRTPQGYRVAGQRAPGLRIDFVLSC